MLPEGDPLLKRPEQLRVQLRNPADNAFLKSLLESPEVAAAAAPPPMEGKVQPLLWGNAREFAQRLAGVPPAECGRTALYLLHRMQFMKVECNSVGTAPPEARVMASDGASVSMVIDGVLSLSVVPAPPRLPTASVN